MFTIGLKIVNQMLAKFSKGMSCKQTHFQNQRWGPRILKVFKVYLKRNIVLLVLLLTSSKFSRQFAPWQDLESDWLGLLHHTFLLQEQLLIYYVQCSFYNCRKYQKIVGFLTFSSSVKEDHWLKKG